MEVSFFKQAVFFWGLGLVLAMPALVLVLGELSERLARRGNPLAQGVRQIRHVVLPVLVTLLVLRHLVGITGAAAWMQSLETLLWLTVAYAGLTLLRNTSLLSDLNPTAWVGKIPGLVFIIVRTVMIFWVLVHILSEVWGFDLKQYATSLGFASMAIAFALQEPLSNLVSGFLLLADRPFQVGDWCQIDGRWLLVRQTGWRTTRFESYGEGATVVMPNGTLGKADIINYGQQGALHVMRHMLHFSHDDPPNVVKQVVMDVLVSVDEILEHPAPEVITYAYEETAIVYRMSFYLDFWNWASARDQVYTQLYYAIRRHGLTLARPLAFRGGLDALKPQKSVQQIADTLRTSSLFASLPPETIDGLVAATSVHDYAENEHIVRQGKPDDGFYVIVTGEVSVTMQVGTGPVQHIAYHTAGDFFGEMALLANEPSPVGVVAVTDVRVLIIEGGAITQLIEQSPQFALEMNFFIEKRQTHINTIAGVETERRHQTARHDWINLIKEL